MGEPWLAGRGSASGASGADLQRGRRGEPDSAGRGRQSRRRQKGRLGLPGLRCPRPAAMVQALLLPMGQQPAVFKVLLAHSSSRPHAATS